MRERSVPHHGGMRHPTAVQRLRTIAGNCQRISHGWSDCPALVAAYAFGAVLDSPAEPAVVAVAFVLDRPADELTWGVQPPYCHSLIHLLDLQKAPVDWYWRPAAGPVGNHLIRRPLRFWSLDGGTDTTALDALARGEADALRLPDPPPAERRRQQATELEASLAQLRRVESEYFDRGWRSAHRGFGLHPENHLWDAVHGYLELLAEARGDAPGEA